jgi:hypothetical protein
MPRDKLVTLACALAILASGACFLPPPRPGPPPPPPLARVRGIRSLCVRVTNQSQTQHTDPVAFGHWVVESIDKNAYHGMPKAHLGEANQFDDAILQISIADERLIAPPLEAAEQGIRYSFALKMDVTLTSSSGTEIWSEKDLTEYRSYIFQFAAPDDPWKSNRFEDWVRNSVCATLVSRALWNDR